MSLFGSLMRDMERDPIFGAHQRAMNRMMNSFFGAPAAGGFGLSLMGPPPGGMGHPHHQHHHHHRGPEEEDDMLMPFGAGALSPFGAFGVGGFPDMSRMMTMDPGNGHAFSSSSFVSISSAGPDGRPQVYQASSETRQGPDGIKETRKTQQDSHSGTKRMAVGRHIGSRSHVVEREQNMRTGQLNENHEFYNMAEEEAPRFDQEWRHRAHHGAGHGYSHSPSMPAIASSSAASLPSSYIEHPSDEPTVVEEVAYNHNNGYQPHRSQSSVTIEELPASDEEAEQQQSRSSRRSYPHASSATAAPASSSRRSPYGASKEKRQKRSKVGKKY